ncbi:hypothetical protein RRG08_025370 [Elysia crispata]|uniref:Uncharacterized protein n=1 Tax=Elysia crispata TaxID=231223 RepID=A0AAE1EAQ2_9GAST|nr:hypothetical protein RRG08_025370 [Elysia crispata]
MVQPNPSNVFSRKGHTLTDFMNSDKLFSTIVQTSAFQDVLSIIKNEASRVQLPSAMFNNTREVIFAFLRLDLLGTVRRVLSQRPASTWFPQSSHVSDVCYSHLMTYFEGLIGRQVSNVTSEAEGTRLISKEWALQSK